MTRANIINLFDTLLASWLMAITLLHANPHLPSTVMNVNGQATTVHRYQTAQLIRTMVILSYVGEALRDGSMATWRGVMYFTISQVGKKIKSYFYKDVKRVCNTLNLPKHVLCKTESTAMAFGDLRIKNVETGVVINLLELSVLDDSILKSNKFELLHKGKVDKVIVVEKRTIYHRMVEAGFDKTMNAILLTDMGIPSLQGKAWLRLIIKALNISDDKCYGVCDFGPYGWEVLHSYYFVKNPIECENVYNTNMKIVMTPALMTNNFPEAKHTENTAFTKADKKIFKFLLKPENQFIKDLKRFDQLKMMYEGQFKCDLDLLDFETLLVVIEYAINRGYVI